MNVRTDINNVLMQMRDMQVQAQGQINKPAELNRGPEKTDGPGFGEMLTNAVNNVNETQMAAGCSANCLCTGRP